MSKKLKFETVKNFYGDVAEFVPQGAELERKTDPYAVLQAGDNLTIEAVFSAPIADREGDLVWPAGCVSDYYNGVILWNHELSALPIGRCDDFQIKADGVFGKIKLASEYAFARDVYSLVKERILKGISLGFIPLEILQRGTKAFADFASKHGLNIADVERIISKWEWLETSICPVGMCREALITGLANKSLSLSEQSEKAFGVNDPQTKALIAISEKYCETQNQIEVLQKTVKEFQAKAEAPKPVKDFADMSWSALVRVLQGSEDDLKGKLDVVWGEAASQVATLDTANAPLDAVALDLSNILSTASGEADKLTREYVNGVADQVFSGYRTGYDGVTPIKEIEQVDKWRKEFTDNYLAKLQPDPTKPLQATSVEEFKNDFLRAAQAGEALPTLDLSASSEVTATQATFGAQQNLLADLIAESPSGDLVQIEGLDDERLCSVCAEYIGQFLSVSGESETFPSLQSARDRGIFHPNCRCVVIPVASAVADKAVKVTKAEAPIAQEVNTKPVVTVKVIRQPRMPITLSDAMRAQAKALAAGRLV